MSGHNKWSQIKLKKGKTDAKKSQVFSKYAKLIANEARMAKGNKDAPALRAAIERARKENMPNENIERAIKKATEGGGALEAIMYEGYGPGGVALLIEVLTDSRNRSAGEIKHLLAENGGNLASPGAAVWAFEKRTTPALADSPSAKGFGGTLSGTSFGKGENTPPADLPAEASAQAGDGSAPLTRGDTTHESWVATTTVPLEDADLEKLEKLVEALEASEDVQEVVTNAE